MFTVERSGDIEILRMQYGPANALDIDFCVGLTNSILELSASSSPRHPADRRGEDIQRRRRPAPAGGRGDELPAQVSSRPR